MLQEREFERVGGTKTIKVNVRIIATSNRDLMPFVEKGMFRSDLYYRLNVFPVHVAPLRERPEDTLLLAESFLRRFARKHGQKIPGFTDGAAAALLAYPWPGNVRELQNTIERAVILSENGRPAPSAALGLPVLSRSADAAPAAAITAPIFTPPAPTAAPAIVPAPAPSGPPPAELLPETSSHNPSAEPATAAVATADEPAATAPNPSDEIMPLDQMEKQAILAALRRTGGNRTKTADLLKISIRTLRNKLQEYRASGDYTDGDETEG